MSSFDKIKSLVKPTGPKPALQPPTKEIMQTAVYGTLHVVIAYFASYDV
jgi:hypothetical protein